VVWNLTEVLNALYGGLMIGLAAALLMVFNGRIAGISGIFAGLLQHPFKFHWRWAFILGLVVSPFIYQLLFTLPVVSSIPNMGTTIFAGLLVGIGTRLGNGCTSGHGVCGIARFSKRSLVATCTFMLTGMLTVFIMRHTLG